MYSTQRTRVGAAFMMRFTEPMRFQKRMARPAPASTTRHGEAVRYQVANGQLTVSLAGGQTVALAQPDKFAGYRGSTDAPEAILLRNHGMHIEIQLDRTHPVGRTDRAGVADIVLEAAVST